MPDDVKRERTIRAILAGALDQRESERSGWLRQACEGDSELLYEVTKRLDWEKRTGGLSQPVIDPEATVTYAGSGGTAGSLPLTIGRYRIIRVLGEGGMGTVYEAEQDQPRRTVALKVVKRGASSPALLRRFEHESQLLGRLQHPGIAQIYEAGTANTGFGVQPYFAMEFIRGEYLLMYARTHQLNLRQSLELMARVCDAVQHAHQRGIIHRDLKPGNIMVDESGQPKILDFGVARVTDSDARATRQTDVGQLVGTLSYMSPEQVLADPLELDTRSDIYALGVILYELLAGRLPYLLSEKLHEAIQAIQEEDPAPLSSIDKRYKGDIETIVGKALEKDKTRRYASAADLAGDIQRFLKDEPIAARPASTVYQLRKFAWRHRALVGGLAAVIVVLVAGVVASTWQAVRARRERDRATSAERTANAVNDFLQNDLLAQASAYTQARPDTRPDPNLTVRTALDRAAARIEGKFHAQPTVEAAIRQTIGNTYVDLGLLPEGQRQLELALELERTALGENHPDALITMRRLGSVLQLEGQFARAENLLRQAVAGLERALGAEHPETLAGLSSLGLLLNRAGRYPESEALHKQILEADRRVYGEEDKNTLSAMNLLASVYIREAKYREAQALSEKAVEGFRRTLGDEAPTTVTAMGVLASVYTWDGQRDRAAAIYNQTFEINRRILGPEHPNTLGDMNNLAVALRTLGKYAEAEGLLNQLIAIDTRVQGPEHPDTLEHMDSVALVYSMDGRNVEAEALHQKILNARLRVLGEDHPSTLLTMNTLGDLYLGEGEYAKAEALLRRCVPLIDTKMPQHFRRFQAHSLLGRALAAQRKYAEAEPLLLTGYDGMIQREATVPPFNPRRERQLMERAGTWIVDLYQAWGQPAKANGWQTKLAARKAAPSP